ncbi:general secretion pathway protein GspB [Marinobacter caseinilyticus]|uniref:general secretion pathway protein GspB n=1 Tax=Marinobacter caseinilyticus TaxID=2692195 RepID=UPI00140D99C4|nr:general secretion pathway protein GspB [Marinobacter caseinilyticus]
MSYILDALRKSESERQQGRIPDLGQQVQMIHQPKKKSTPVSVWLGCGLILNAIILAAVFWPSIGFMSQGASLASGQASEASQITEDTDFDGAEVVAVPVPAVESERPPEKTTMEQPVDALGQGVEPPDTTQDRPTMIVPSWSTSDGNRKAATPPTVPYNSNERVPHLVELPMSFQHRVPTLIFNSHVYASDPSARRVMINDQYLRAGDSFSGIRVDRITADGVELSLDGRRFRVGVVRDWISPR